MQFGINCASKVWNFTRQSQVKLLTVLLLTNQMQISLSAQLSCAKSEIRIWLVDTRAIDKLVQSDSENEILNCDESAKPGQYAVRNY